MALHQPGEIFDVKLLRNVCASRLQVLQELFDIRSHRSAFFEWLIQRVSTHPALPLNIVKEERKLGAARGGRPAGNQSNQLNKLAILDATTVILIYESKEALYRTAAAWPNCLCKLIIRDGT